MASLHAVMARQTGFALVRMPWHFCAPATHQKIKIAAFVGLQHAVDIQLLVTALGRPGLQRLPRLPVGVPLGDIGIAHFQI